MEVYRRHTVGHVMGGKAHYTTSQCCHSHALAQSSVTQQTGSTHTHCLFTNMNMAANTTGGEHTRCLHTMPRVKNNSQTMPAHGSSHHGSIHVYSCTCTYRLPMQYHGGDHMWHAVLRIVKLVICITFILYYITPIQVRVPMLS